MDAYGTRLSSSDAVKGEYVIRLHQDGAFLGSGDIRKHDGKYCLLEHLAKGISLNTKHKATHLMKGKQNRITDDGVPLKTCLEA